MKPRINMAVLVRDRDGAPLFDEPLALAKHEREVHRQRPDNPNGLSDDEYRAIFFRDGMECFR
jgi:hypothetical protein